MSLQSIRESYSKLLTTFTDAGVKLNESQKSDLDEFILALESTMSKQRKSAIEKTKIAVESKLEKEYQTLFESLMANMSKNHKLASKIQNLSVRLEESKKVANKVNDYLDLYVESVLPKKTIVDYDRMHKLEKIHQTLKESLCLTEDDVEEKKIQLEESFKKRKSKLETEVAKIEVKLNESMKLNQSLKKKLDKYKASDLLESKTKDLPSFEAKQIKKRLAESTVDEIERKFDKTLKSIQENTSKIEADSELALEDEIKKIMDSDDDNVKIKECGDKPAADENSDEDFETIEQINLDADGDVQLNESDIIDPSIMKMYCALSQESN